MRECCKLGLVSHQTNQRYWLRNQTSDNDLIRSSTVYSAQPGLVDEVVYRTGGSLPSGCANVAVTVSPAIGQPGGDFELRIDCGYEYGGRALPKGQLVVDTVQAGLNESSDTTHKAYECPGTTAGYEAGREHIFLYAPTTDAMRTARLDGFGAGQDADLFVFEVGPNGVYGQYLSDCVASSANAMSPSEVVTFAAEVGKHYALVVDSKIGETDYALIIE